MCEDLKEICLYEKKKNNKSTRSRSYALTTTFSSQKSQNWNMLRMLHITNWYEPKWIFLRSVEMVGLFRRCNLDDVFFLLSSNACIMLIFFCNHSNTKHFHFQVIFLVARSLFCWLFALLHSIVYTHTHTHIYLSLRSSLFQVGNYLAVLNERLDDYTPTTTTTTTVCSV